MGGQPAIINYDIFAAVFALLTLFYLIAATLNDSFVIHRAIMLTVDVLNCLWLFVAAVATAAILGAHSCGNQVSLISTHNRYSYVKLTIIAGLLKQQQNHPRFRKEMSGIASCNCILLLRLLCMARINSLHFLGLEGRHEHARWKVKCFHEPGLSGSLTWVW